MYKIVKYVKDRGMGVSVRYNQTEDIIQIEVYKPCGVSIYKVNMVMYGIEAINPESGDLLFGNVKSMVEALERSLNGESRLSYEFDIEKENKLCLI
jgi:hypothetical protein